MLSVAIDTTDLELEATARAFYQTNQGLAFGPYLLGYAADGFAYGLLLMQILQWFTLSWATERTTIRILVWYILIFGTVQTALSSRWLFNLFAYGFDVYRNFFNFKWSSSFLLMTGCMQTPVAVFFAHRAYIFANKARWVLLTTIPLLFISLVSVIVVKATAPMMSTFLFDPEYMAARVSIYVWLGTATLANIIITITIAWALLSPRTAVHAFSENDGLSKKMIIIGLESLFAPTIFSAAFLVAFLAGPEFHVSAFFMCSPKVYGVSLLGSLNARHYLHRDLAPRSDPSDRSLLPRLRLTKRLSSFGLKGESSHQDHNKDHGHGHCHGHGHFGPDHAHAQTEIHVETETIQQTYRLEPIPVKHSINRSPLPWTSSNIDEDVYIDLTTGGAELADSPGPGLGPADQTSEAGCDGWVDVDIELDERNGQEGAAPGGIM
ncbi:hypothetical protein I317_01036 [Kwoniella heveanensis CBS 569]|nr:hypothetical protein I317_01036 [Kwoniella heveanensis CBS 569]